MSSPVSASSEFSKDSEMNITPIPNPSHPRQNRAIGLVKGVFQRQEGEMTRGTLKTIDDIEIEAVLLGKMLSLLKNHVDLSQPHLWVVYPRTRQANDILHLQITGLWEPETLHPDSSASDASVQLQDGFFSIRGEVIYASTEKKVVIVKIRQSPKQSGKKPKFFKIKLKGVLSDQPVGRFWDLKVQRQQQDLVIIQGEDLGWASKRKPFSKRPRKGNVNRQKPQKSLPKPRSASSPIAPPKPVRKKQ